MTEIALKNVTKSFGNVDVIHGIDLHMASGEFIVFVGPSGCGKSTLLRIISGLEQVTSGDVVIDGKIVNSVAASDRGLAMVFQSYALYPHMSVFENIAFNLRLAKISKEDVKKQVMEAAKILKLEALLERSGLR